jgi:hypothetical protein
MSDDTSARLALDYIAPGQAQKELSHNEALARLDFLVQPAVLAVGIDTPVDAPEPGQCWIVGAAPTAAWAAWPGALACWTSGGWRFAAPFEGMAVWSIADRQIVRYSGSAWTAGLLCGQALIIDGQTVVRSQQAAIADPAGGTTIDTEARSAVAAILVALRGHGLVSS